jgi:hypothetical protein
MPARVGNITFDCDDDQAPGSGPRRQSCLILHVPFYGVVS